MNTPLHAQMDRARWIALAGGIAALAAAIAGAFANPSQFYFSYLFGFLFWLGLSLGGFMLIMIHQLTGGRWGYPTRRFFEAASLTLPLMLVLFVPVCFGLAELYPWARAAEVQADTVLAGRHAYQNGPAFILRAAFCLLIWSGMAFLLRRWSLQQDGTTDAGPTRKARALSGPGLIAFGLLATFAYVDWIMSLEAHWYSSLFAVIVLIGHILTAYAFGIVLLTLFKGRDPLSGVVTRTHYHHLGNLLLTFVLFWTYVSFGQLLIIYSGDLPQEIEWYLHRIAGNWKWVIACLGLFHFFLPFFLLLFRPVKRHVAALTTLAALLLIVHVVYSYWLVMPALHRDGMVVSWLDFAAPIGIGGLWIAWFLSRLKAAALLPQHDPGLQFALGYEH